MIKKIQDSAALFFIGAVVLLSILAILGIWDVLAQDVLMKSFQTIGLLAVAALIISGAAQAIDSRKETVPGAIPEVANPLFGVLRHMTVAVLIVSVSLLALLGILAIWDVLSGEVTEKSLASMALLVFSSLVIIVTCANREGNNALPGGKKLSTGMTVVIIILAIWLVPMLLGMMW